MTGPVVASFVDPDEALPVGIVLRPSARAAAEHLTHSLLVLAGLALFAGPVGRAFEVDSLRLFFEVVLFEGPFVVLAAFGVVGPILNLVFTRYVLSETGIVVRSTFLSRKEQRVDWSKVTAVVHRWTLLDRLLGLERLDVVAYGARGTTLHLVGLRKAATYRDVVARHMREHASVANLFVND